MMLHTLNKIGDYFFDRQVFTTASQFYDKAGNRLVRHGLAAAVRCRGRSVHVAPIPCVPSASPRRCPSWARLSGWSN